MFSILLYRRTGEEREEVLSRSVIDQTLVTIANQGQLAIFFYSQLFFVSFSPFNKFSLVVSEVHWY